MSQPPEPPFTPQPQGISLEELAAAFAEAMGRAPGPAADAPHPTVAEEPTPPQPAQATAAAETLEPEPLSSAEEDACPISPLSILEAMLFVGNRDGQPLPAAQAAELMRGVTPEEIPDLVADLNRRYTANGCPYEIVSNTGGYRMTLRKRFHPLRNRFYGRIREARLSLAAIEVLAILAYQQPLTSEQVGTLRSKPSGQVLAHLVHRGLLRIERSGGPRQAGRYFTTDRFLKLFGLGSLAELPQSEELDR